MKILLLLLLTGCAVTPTVKHYKSVKHEKTHGPLEAETYLMQQAKLECGGDPSKVVMIHDDEKETSEAEFECQ